MKQQILQQIVDKQALVIAIYDKVVIDLMGDGPSLATEKVLKQIEKLEKEIKEIQ